MIKYACKIVIPIYLVVLSTVLFAHDTTRIHPLISINIAREVQGADLVNKAYSEIYAPSPKLGEEFLYWGTDFYGKHQHIPIRVTILASTTSLPVFSPEYPLADSTVRSNLTPVSIRVENDISAQVMINGITADNSLTNDQAVYVADVPMVEGPNVISVDVTGTNGISAATYQYNLNLVSQSQPTAVITSHADGATLTTDPVTIVATVEDPTAVLTLFVNDVNKLSPTITGNVATWSNVLISNDGANDIKIMDKNYSAPAAQIVLNLVQPPEPIITVTSHYYNQPLDQSSIILEGVVNDPNANFTIGGVAVPLTLNAGKGEFSINLDIPNIGISNSSFALNAVGATNLEYSKRINLSRVNEFINAGDNTIPLSQVITMTSQENRKAVTVDTVFQWLQPSSSTINVTVESIDTVSNAPNWVVNYSISTTTSTPSDTYQAGLVFRVSDKFGNVIKTIYPDPSYYYFAVQ